MVVVDLEIVNDQINIYGETVTLVTISSSVYSKWGDETNTTSSTSAVAVYNVYGKNSIYETDGEFTPGDITFFFKSSQGDIKTGTEVIRSNGDRYRIKDSRDHSLEGNTYVYEAFVDKV